MTIQIPWDSIDDVRVLFGNFDEHTAILETELDVRITHRDDAITIVGRTGAVQIAKETVEKLLNRIAAGERIDRFMVKYVLGIVGEGNGHQVEKLGHDVVAITNRGKEVKPRTLGQKRYIEVLNQSTVTFCIGPAGTGKTYLAIAKAVVALKNREVARIVLTRPAVEAGEKLGFLPGDLQQKVDPYLRPLYDALQDFLGGETFFRLMENGTIEVAPLAYMRGRTLHESYLIMDEAQNCTKEQMKMFLTRFGDGSKVVVNGDITQMDLPHESNSGLVHASKVLQNVKGCEFVYLTDKDVVRHDIVQSIIRAYESYENKNDKKQQKKGK